MRVKEFMADNPLISECGAQLRYYSVSADCIDHKSSFMLKEIPLNSSIFVSFLKLPLYFFIFARYSSNSLKCA